MSQKRATDGAKKQIKRYFGEYLPPRKDVSHENGITIRFVLAGHIPSLKNLVKAVADRNAARKMIREWEADARRRFKSGKMTVDIGQMAGTMQAISDQVWAKIVNTQKYKDWEALAVAEISRQKDHHLQRLQQKYGQIFPVRLNASISVYFAWKSKHIRDTISKLETVQDVLVKAGVLLDDNYLVLDPIKARSASYKGEVIKNTCDISITFNPGRNTAGAE